MPLFDRYVFADYSGQQDDGPQRAAISLWIADHGAEPHPETNDGAGFTRIELRLFIEKYLAAATRDGCRVVFGTDHQWSWPRSLWAAAGLPNGTWRERIQSLVHGADLRPALTINTTTVNYAPHSMILFTETHMVGHSTSLKETGSTWDTECQMDGKATDDGSELRNSMLVAGILQRSLDRTESLVKRSVDCRNFMHS